MVWLSDLLVCGCRSADLILLYLYLKILHDIILKPYKWWNIFKIQITTKIVNHETWGSEIPISETLIWRFMQNSFYLLLRYAKSLELRDQWNLRLIRLCVLIS